MLCRNSSLTVLGSADNAGILQTAFTMPYDGFAAPVVPVDAPEHFTAVAAEDKMGEAVVACCCSCTSGHWRWYAPRVYAPVLPALAGGFRQILINEF